LAKSVRSIFKRSGSRTKGQSTSRRFSSLLFWTFNLTAAAIVVVLGWQFVERMFVKPPVSSTRERTDLLVRAGEHIQLNVLNGSGAANVARIYTDFLRARKFDVVSMSNYKTSTIEHTYIIDKVGDSSASHKIAYALGISPTRIIVEPDSEAFVDAAVVIGKDFSATNPLR
jgi:hypothetical protein